MNRDIEKVILIGGAPTVGKSYTTREISRRLNLPWISTDTIRAQMRKIVSKEHFPNLFKFSEPTVDMGIRYLSNNTAEQIVDDQNRESLDVWKGIKALIDTDFVWRSFIIEGVAIIPKFVKNFTKKQENVISIFLVDNNKKHIEETIYNRGLWDTTDKYPKEMKKKEVEWVMSFNGWLKKEAKRYGLEIVEVGDRKKYLYKIESIIKNS